MNGEHALKSRGPLPPGGEPSWKALVAALELQPHPEGGHYREVFRSDFGVEAGGMPRSAGTSIYYLLAEGAYSAWHRIDADEIWYFHAGGPLALHVLHAGGDLVTHFLGDPLRHAQAALQAVVPRGCWFAAELATLQDTRLPASGAARPAHPPRHQASSGTLPLSSEKSPATWPERLTDCDDFCLVGCAVTPGFEFSGFQLAAEADIANAIQQHGGWIRRLLKA